MLLKGKFLQFLMTNMVLTEMYESHTCYDFLDKLPALFCLSFFTFLTAFKGLFHIII